MGEFNEKPLYRENRRDFKCFTNATIEICKKIKTLLILNKQIGVGNQVIHFDPIVLFRQLILLVERSKNTVNYFAYELIPYPTFLFQDSFVRHPGKQRRREREMKFLMPDVIRR